jgi:3-hydroxyisobutyrate dehydrogenase-like beta-hydroxyacid dehydrogenase
MQSVSIVGLGVMGSALAHTLLAAGYDVTVWNRTQEKAESLVKAGASLAGTAADAVKNSEVTITCIRSRRSFCTQRQDDY